MTFFERLRDARAAGDAGALAREVPFGTFLGIDLAIQDGVLIGRLEPAEHIVGNPTIPALHGGSIAALLESTAIASVLWELDEPTHLPRPITLTFDYLRTGRLAVVWCRARVVRQGRRVVTVHASAWQEDPDRPIAIAQAHLLLG